ncbi:hypothetical protein FRC19_009203 [Serendipita sp. 401]|nr:hypothetical protein FRC19_009203 [Serendipita sp. 401]KAG9058424.1 hypothetical protein FS842_009492 [Serendipita sp. 407]
MSERLGAYSRRSNLPVFSQYETLGNGSTKGSSQRQTTRSRRLIRWCLAPALLLLVFILWFSRDAVRQPEPPPAVKEVDPFENCPQAIQDAGVPSLEELVALESASTSTSINGYSPHRPSEDPNKWARIISATDLMDMVAEGKSPSPRIMHQSWKDHTLPDHFKRWSKAWRQLLDETWVYVLWTDADNRKLVETYYPEYLKAYDLLPREIYRADMVRNMYMHHFGGVYADLDLVPLSPLHRNLPVLMRKELSPIPIAYVGHMGDDNYAHSIPNAFMVSTSPKHPFWIKPLDFIKKHQLEEEYNSQPEGLTGPVALRTCLREWQTERESREGEGEFSELRVLPNEKIYPFSWYDSPLVHHCLCRLHSPYFSEPRCHSQFPKSWTITYWTHSWGF